jgi:tryptophan 2,3-dioxygenase
MKKEIYYSDYLQLDKILNAQTLESDKANAHAHDEMLFIVIHQSYELWFKQILFEIDSVMQIMSQSFIQDNSPDLFVVHHRLHRVAIILQTLIGKVDILETMTPLDFLDFRDRLRPASGFQSIQFKVLEAKLGLRMEHRHGKEYYTSQLKPHDKAIIEQVETAPSLIELINEWLERMPFFQRPEYWDTPCEDDARHPFWQSYRQRYAASLLEAEKFNLSRMEDLLFGSENKPNENLSPKARRSALFIMMYRDFPLLQLPFNILNGLLDIDEGIATWRYRHMNMVHRMIGTRIGTGGSSGKEYLRATVNKHYIFSEIAELTSFLIERKNLPPLSARLKQKLGFD